MPNVIGKTNLPTPDDYSQSSVDNMYKEYVLLKRNIDDLTARQNEIKKELSSFVESNGLEDDKGHMWYDMPEYNGYVGMQRQRRVTQKIDEEAALSILTDKGLADRCFETKPVLDQEQVLKCMYEGLINEDELDTIFPKSVTSAFVLMKK